MKYCLFILLLFIASCGMKGEVSDPVDKIINCRDTRDGERFSFHTAAIHDVVIGIGSPSRFTVTDITGKVHEMSSDLNLVIKCEESGK